MSLRSLLGLSGTRDEAERRFGFGFHRVVLCLAYYERSHSAERIWVSDEAFLVVEIEAIHPPTTPQSRR